MPRPGRLRFAASIADAVAAAELIVEAVPERLEVKHAVYAEIEAAAKPDAIISSSTSGIMPTNLQAGMRHPGRLLVGHPFNPVYLLPLVELVGGKATEANTIKRAGAYFTASARIRRPSPKLKPLWQTGSLRRYGARRCGWLKTASPQPKK